MTTVFLSWVVSPILSGLAALIFFLVIRTLVLRRRNSVKMSYFVSELSQLCAHVCICDLPWVISASCLGGWSAYVLVIMHSYQTMGGQHADLRISLLPMSCAACANCQPTVLCITIRLMHHTRSRC